MPSPVSIWWVVHGLGFLGFSFFGGAQCSCYRADSESLLQKGVNLLHEISSPHMRVLMSQCSYIYYVPRQRSRYVEACLGKTNRCPRIINDIPAPARILNNLVPEKNYVGKEWILMLKEIDRATYKRPLELQLSTSVSDS